MQDTPSIYVLSPPIPMCRVTPQFVTECSIVEHLQFYMKHDMCHAHLGQSKIFYNIRTLFDFQPIMSLQHCWMFSNTIQKIFEVSWTQAGLDSRTWNWSRSSPARSQWLVASGQIFTECTVHHLTQPGPGHWARHWWPPSCKVIQHQTSESSVHWQYLFSFEWDRC